MHGVGISYPRHISHVDRIHMGDLSHTQGIYTVAASQHPGSSVAALRSAPPHPVSRQTREDGASLTNLGEAAPQVPGMQCFSAGLLVLRARSAARSPEGTA